MTTPPVGTPTRPPAHAAPRRVALTVAGALFMEGFDSAVILTSLPQMAADLGQSPLRLSLAVTAYLIALAILIPISGWVADRFGARRVYCASILVFVGGSLWCAFSHSLVSLVLGRFVQGTGGAMMAPVGRLILTRGVEKRALVSVMNYRLLPGIVGPTLGPVIGGFITTYASWRWNFFINVPIGVLGLIMAWRFIPPSPPMPQARFDWLGFLLVGSAAAGLQTLIEALGHRLLPAPILIALGMLVALCAGLYAGHARRRVADRSGPVPNPQLFGGDSGRQPRPGRGVLDADSIADLVAAAVRLQRIPLRLADLSGVGRGFRGASVDLLGARSLRLPERAVLRLSGCQRHALGFHAVSSLFADRSVRCLYPDLRHDPLCDPLEHRCTRARRHRARRHGPQQRRGIVCTAHFDEFRGQLRCGLAVARLGGPRARASRFLDGVPDCECRDVDRGLRDAAPA